MGSKRFDRLSDFVRHEANVYAVCRRCDNSSVIEAVQLQRWFLCHNWNGEAEAIPRRLRCSACGARSPRVIPAPGQPTGPSRAFFPPSEDAWKQLVRRLRG
ncbi:hypothetical protein [Sphingomonas oryzagri]|uniref:Zinc-ribbon domain-containing protein n=1 Tax=Sphingomonas oryzagri TaxID=3042314 RepID=A0ABT6N7Q6_9SPHN|nr:hypothetical protein [Sphingomonas oryzagri]MDH7641152.1 hypothetical protein [Sphingomonas oryzagri]